jgi:hypothetical protein
MLLKKHTRKRILTSEERTRRKISLELCDARIINVSEICLFIPKNRPMSNRIVIYGRSQSIIMQKNSEQKRFDHRHHHLCARAQGDDSVF